MVGGERVVSARRTRGEGHGGIWYRESGARGRIFPVGFGGDRSDDTWWCAAREEMPRVASTERGVSCLTPNERQQKKRGATPASCRRVYYSAEEQAESYSAVATFRIYALLYPSKDRPRGLYPLVSF